MSKKSLFSNLVLLFILIGVILIGGQSSLEHVESKTQNETKIEGITEVFTKSFDQYTIFWILISGSLGAIISQVAKFGFEHSLPQWQLARATKIAIQKYYYPLLLSALDVRDIINEILLNIDEQIEKDNDDYYKLRNLWFFSSFLGWYKILQNESLFEFQDPKIKSEIAKSFALHYRLVITGISSPIYLSKIKDIPSSDKKSASIPALALAAIGELMIDKKENNKAGPTNSNLVHIVEFMRNYNNDADYSLWFPYLENFLCGLGQSYAKWNRMIIIYTHICILIRFLEEYDARKYAYSRWLTNFKFRNSHNKSSSIEILKFQRYTIHPEVEKLLKEDAESLGYKIIFE